MHTSSFTLRTLGGAGLVITETDELCLGPGKPLAVLTYLALTPGRRASRDTLLDLCWADVDPERGRPALRQVLFHIRRVLGEAAIVGAEELVLQVPLVCDRDRFLEAIARDALADAVELYAGPFLPSFGVPGGAAFEHWADLERDRLQSLFGRSAEMLVRRHLNASRWREARIVAERARTLLPDRESNWRLTLECALSAGDALAIAVEADSLERFLADTGKEGDPATRALLLHARRPTSPQPAAAAPESLRAELTGRGREFAALISAWQDDALRGRSRHLHVTAPAGVGKSRLLQEAAGRLRAMGGTVVSVAAAARDREIPYASLGDLAAALAALPGAAGVAPGSAAVLVALNPALTARFAVAPEFSRGEENLRRRIHAVLDLLQAVCEEHPVALLIDDVHWMDDVSFRAVQALSARLNELPCLVVTAARPSRQLTTDATMTIALAPLTLQETAELVSALGTLPVDAAWAAGVSERLHRASRGVPLLVLQSLRLAMDAGALVLASGTWLCPAPEQLEGLLGDGEAMRRRVAAVSPLEARVLRVLAVLGAAAPTADVAADAESDLMRVTAALHALEHLGLVHLTAGGWDTTHDEVARCALELASPSEVAALERRIGLRLVTTPTDDPHRERRGCRHLLHAGDTRHVGTAFRAFAQRARQRGDRRAFEALAEDLVGGDASPGVAAALARAIPWHWRFGLWSRGRQRAAVLAGGALLVGSLAMSTMVGSVDAHRSRLWYALQDGSTLVATPDPSGWSETMQPVTAVSSTSELEAPARGFDVFTPVVGPPPTLAAWNVEAGGARTIDIWVRDETGVRNVTPRDRDQVVGDISPDGRFLIAASNERNAPSEGAYDIAVIDARTGGTRFVSSTPEHEHHPVISPDGTRIAFLRESLVHPIQLCVVPFDGLDAPECRSPGGAFVVAVPGWLNGSELLVAIDSGGTQPLVRYDWDTGRLVPVLGPIVNSAALSPDRAWVVARARVAGVPGLREWLLPADGSGPPRQVGLPAAAMTSVRWWEGRRTSAQMIDHLVFTDTSRTLHVGVSRLLSVQAQNPSGDPVPIRGPVRWRSSDTTIATVSPGGIVRASRAGTVTITADLAGWRAARLALHVQGAAARLALSERWEDRWQERWFVFGAPPPMVVTGPGGIAGFWNNGDGVYANYAISRRPFAADLGLGLEVRLSTPLVRDTWIRASALLLPHLDTMALLRSDPRGQAVGVENARGSGCGAAYPATDGAFGRRHLGVNGGSGGLLGLPDSLGVKADGDWWHLRIQIFPDGRCGVAVNGVPVWRGLDPLPMNAPYWIRLGHQSADTRVLHGPLEVWTGVRTDVDWSLLPEHNP